MSLTTSIVLPGDEIPRESLPTPQNKKKALTLGPGLRHIPPETITATVAGALVTDNKKNAAWIEYNSGRVRNFFQSSFKYHNYSTPVIPLSISPQSHPLTSPKYLPSTGDLIIATVSTSGGENFNCSITPHTPFATLPHLSFEGATRKTRPVLPPNSLVYARILSASTSVAAELTCVDPSTGRSEGLGPLKGGMVFSISLGMARRLLAGRKGGVSVLEGLSEKMGFEVAVGRNGMLWVEAGSVKRTLAVGRAVQEVDEGGLGEKGQKKVVDRVLRGV
jgi:exosome complex component RRP40